MAVWLGSFTLRDEARHRGARRTRTARRPLSQSRPRTAKKKPSRAKHARPSKKAESPYFLQPATGGIGVYRRPVGNRATPTNCGIMPNRKAADALVAQLKRAESVVSDLFLEATDDGIEALEAVLGACREAVLKAGGGQKERTPRPAAPRASAGENGAAPEGGDGAAGRKRGRRRGRGRGPRRPGSGGEASAEG